MDIIKTIGKAATTINQTLFQRRSTNPNTKSTTNYLDMVYDQQYKLHRRYNDYKKMMTDPQIKVGMSILQMFFLSRELHVTPGGETPQDEEAATFIENELKQDMITPIRQVRKNIYTALPYAFSAQEIVYKIRGDGRIGLQGMYSIHRKTLDHKDAFQFNDQGDLIAIQQKDSGLIQGGDPIPIEKILLYSYDAEFDDPHGNSMLDEVYKNYYMKNKNLKGLGIFLEKLGSPFLVTKLSNINYKDEARRNMEEVSEGRTNMTVGAEDDVEIKESSHDGAAYLNSIQYHDNVIFRRFFIGTLLFGQNNDQSGSLSQSKTHLDVTRLLLDGVHEEIAAAIQVVTDQLSEWNFGGAKSPKISFERFEEKDILALLGALQPYVANLTINPDMDKWFDDLISEAVREYSGVEIEKETPPPQMQGQELNNNNGSVNDLKGALEEAVPAPIGK